jgi:hypothetical protein
LWLNEATPFQNFIYALKSKDVKRQYPAMLLRFLNFTNASGETIEEKCISLYDFCQKIENRRALESELMRYIHFQQGRVDNKEISPGTLRNYMKAIKHFFTMNDILVNWDKIKKGMPSANQTSNDRIPEIEEIKLLLNYTDIRIRPIILTMLSSGIRVGAWNWLRWKNVIPMEKEGSIVAAKLIVYYQEPEQYNTYITPEAYFSLKSYMNFRELHGEKITGESWLIRDQWQKISKTHGHRIGQAAIPKKLDAEGIRRLIYDAWKIQGVISIRASDSEVKNYFKSSHGFRKFFQTQCEMVIKSEDVEILMGHGSSSRGLKANYYRPKEEYLLQQFLKVVDLLTVNEEQKLSIQVKDLLVKDRTNELIIKEKLEEKEQQIEKLNRRYEESIKSIKEEMEQKFQEFITKIDTSRI